MKQYKFKVSYLFSGTVMVRAENGDHARQIVDRDFGMVAGDIATSNESTSKDEEGIVDWDFSIHPTDSKIK